jgi:mxaJ protein
MRQKEFFALALLAVLPLAGACARGEAAGAVPSPGPHQTLRVCADPNNLPFSNQRLQGLENELAALVAREMGAAVHYTWWAQRRGFIRNTLNAGTCDVVMGVPSSFDLALVTRPYYRSTYVFLSRRDRRLGVRSFDDPVLRKLRIGVQLIGDDYANSPPAHAFAKRGIVGNLIGYTVYGDYREDSPPARIVRAVAAGDVDLAVVWGPLAGYFAPRQPVPLEMVPVSPQIDLPFLPYVYDISMAVRRRDPQLRDRLDGILQKKRPEIEAILNRFGVPRVGRARLI